MLYRVSRNEMDLTDVGNIGRAIGQFMSDSSTTHLK